MLIIRIIGEDKYLIFMCMLIMIIIYLCNIVLFLFEKLCMLNMGRKRIWIICIVIIEWRILYMIIILKIFICFKMF